MDSSRLVHVYGLNGMGSEAVALFHRIPSEMLVDHTYVSVLNACSHSKLVDDAQAIFSQIKNKQKRICTVMVGDDMILPSGNDAEFLFV